MPSVVPLLRDVRVWGYLVGWAVLFGSTSWALELAVDARVPTAGLPWWHGAGRIVQALLVIPTLATAVAVAERWPVRVRAHWPRVGAQVGLTLVLAPAWGLVAWWLNPVLALWNVAGGLWGLVAIEAKGVVFAYGTAAVLANMVRRVREQRALAVAAGAARARLAEAQVQAARLDAHSRRVLATLAAAAAMIPRDPARADAMVVDLADDLWRVLEEVGGSDEAPASG
jgi:hypothetical protein